MYSIKETVMEKRRITIRNVPDDVLEKAHRIAELEDRPLSQIIRELLRKWVAENEDKLPKSKPKGKS
jgi:hypothetical protein